ncbi:hypothetical protein CGX12_06305 [Zobellella denitrificans]|uniref:LysR family transcriptional regulator n=1 Tax=Zobellella denitrificans TaxID=347534 RepID=UPI000B8C4714|nr:LysR family transcriptional regulator [Zobellella denitrificans]OXS15993.1 hypothetical protein CGX12_06305 [Zobellella denitrificans]
MPVSPPLNTLRAFEAAARLNSFSAAAGELHLTAAAISHRIKELEQALGVPLFIRQARGVRLTEAGRRYQARIADAFGIIASATTELSQPPLAGPLVLSLPHGFCRHWLLPRLAGLLARHPGLRLTLQAEDRLADLRTGQADLAIRFGAGDYPGLPRRALAGDCVTVARRPALYRMLTWCATRLRGLMPKKLGPWTRCRTAPQPAARTLRELMAERNK